MNLCKYKNIFGEPNKGVHSYRIFNIAIVDVLATLLLAYIFNHFSQVPFLYSSLFMFILGIIVHRLFCVRTTIDKLLFH